ncbi:probable 2-oxoglutarate-dependent dioxygenase At5g05600 [Coffea eugenioides]|uniref:Protein LATERAL BRANCHING OXIDOREDUCTASE 1 n=1 Tax=Coffea arabica TaxID=13443 RepID=A0A6P6UH36_COFAR|nr:probable 2-oxoglutarate-dependent dioxygenase At5g05600 [Coffea arabica]XP_027149361.1 probable 2-oxoglutarate-dependent dioxygenase At5g05600 [Coffea eugenioides]
MGESAVDSAFVQALEHRPKPTRIEDEGIPLIDLSVLNSPHTDADLARLVSEIGDASQKWGFFQVINHGVPLECQEKIELGSRKFFALPKEEKLKVRRTGAGLLGYVDAENTKNVRDWKEVFDFVLKKPTLVAASDEPDDEEVRELTNQWPQNPPEFREVCDEFAREVEKLAFKLMELIALSLGLPKNRFHGFFEDQTTLIRVNHYPPCPSPDLALGVGQHQDAVALTVLAQDDVEGLEVKRKTDGQWILVKPTPNAYIINIADIIQVWSNDKYGSVEHRVSVNSEKERFSIAFFLNPAHYTWVEPLEELINEQNPRKYKAYNSGKFFAARGKLKKIDVCHFKIDN